MLPTKFQFIWPSSFRGEDFNMSFCHHLVSVVCHAFTFHILIFSSENLQPNELKLGRKHLWKVLSKECTFWSDPLPNKSTNQKQELPVVAMFVHRLGQHEQSI
jgi:hypothetical protein